MADRNRGTRRSIFKGLNRISLFLRKERAHTPDPVEEPLKDDVLMSQGSILFKKREGNVWAEESDHKEKQPEAASLSSICPHASLFKKRMLTATRSLLLASLFGPFIRDSNGQTIRRQRRLIGSCCQPFSFIIFFHAVNGFIFSLHKCLQALEKIRSQTAC